jgi:hypothetical protein
VEGYSSDENMWDYLCQLDPCVIGANDKKESIGGGDKQHYPLGKRQQAA